jgi:dethiobiotin synthetase
MRVRRVVVVTGTTTGVGKTYVTAALIAELRRAGIEVAARKPVQSFDAADDATDADVLAAAAGSQPHDVCPPHRWYERPVAPPMAADALGRPRIALADLAHELNLPPHGLVFVEGAGGPLSPIAHDGDTAGLARVLHADVLLVAAAELGTINAVRTCALAVGEPIVYLNHYDDGDELHRRNRSWLSDRDGFRVVTTIGELCSHFSLQEVS